MSLAEALLDLQELTRQLRRECPWDREQTAITIVPHTIEEAYEVADAALAGTAEALHGELGDLLFQVYFLSLLLEEQHEGDLESVARDVHEKLVRRHPHVFGDADARTPGRVRERWEALKTEQEGREGIFHELVDRTWAAAEWGNALSTTLEGQVVRLADSIAYLNHDIADAVRAGLLRTEDLPPRAREVLGETHSQRIDTLVTDAVDASWDAALRPRPSSQVEGVVGAQPEVRLSDDVAAAADGLREYLFANVYLWEERLAEADRARRVIEFLWARFMAHPEEIAASEFTRRDDPLARRVADYIAGMTDLFAIAAADRLGFSG